MTEFTDIFGEGDPTDEMKLDPELRLWVQDGPLGRMLNHPLVQQITIMWKPANEMLRKKQERVAKLTAEGKWEAAIFFYERPYRMTTLDIWWRSQRITREQLHTILPIVWIDTEYPRQFGDIPKRLFREARKIGLVTDIPDAESFALPREPFTVYRGVNRKRDGRGMSWTKSAAIADFFALRLSRTGRGYVFACEATPDRILGLFEGRGESEVVLDIHGLEIRFVSTVRKNA